MIRKTITLISAVVVISGCATPASQQQMISQPNEVGAKINSALVGVVSVRNVTGGQDTNPMWVSQVGTNEFRGALTESLRAYGYLAGESGKSKLIIDANLQSLSQPLLGLTFNVTSTVTYTVQRDGTLKSYPVTATGTATTSDAFIGTERMRIANERSIKENIKQFVSILGTTQSR
jgi:hypothetical protein